jgi:hypothetical protein
MEPAKTTTAPRRVTSYWHPVPPKTRKPWLIIGGFVGGVVLTSFISWLVFSTQMSNTKSAESTSMDRSSTRSGPTPLERAPQAMTPGPSVATARGAERQEASERPAASLATGTWLMEPRGPRGDGVLNLRNGTGVDAVVKLVSVDTPLRKAGNAPNGEREVFWVLYIRAHEEETVKGVAVGGYLLRYALGQDWDVEGQKFLRNAMFYQAGEQLVFTETEPTEYSAGQYTELTITLNEVIGGNLRRVGISEAEFNEGTPAS